MSKRVFLAAALVAAVAGTAAAAPQAQPAPAKPASAAAEAQPKNAADTDKLVELLRKDVRGEKADVVAKTMKLDSTQAAAFWPVYKQYESERAAIGTERLQIIQDFAEHYDSINDTTAKGLVTR